MQGLPVNGRQMSQLMLQAPGSQNAGTGTWGDIRFSGRAVEQNVIKYDGVEGVGDHRLGARRRERREREPFKLQASLENVQEFRVESSGYPAEFGTGTGGQVSVITKSGGNSFHGSVFEYLRSDKLDAANYFDSQRNADGSVIAEAGSAPTVPKSPLKLNQFGGSIGGPLVKDRAFFFGSYEGYRLDAGKNFIEAVPSAAAWARAVPAVAGAAARVHWRRTRMILPGASTNPDFDIAQWQANAARHARTPSAAASTSRSTTTGRRTSACSTTRPRAAIPQDVSGRFFKITINPTNAIFNLQGILGGGMINEFKFGYNARAEHRGRGHAARLREHLDSA